MRYRPLFHHEIWLNYHILENKELIMKNVIKISVVLICLALIFNKKIITMYYVHKFGNWIERDFTFSDFKIQYPNKIIVKDIKILNIDPIKFKDLFSSDLVELEVDLFSLVFKDLVFIKKLIIENPKFYLEIKKNNKENNNNLDEEIFEDNIGLAQKISKTSPDKVWPKKNRDINFLILETKINNALAFLNIFSDEKIFKVELSDIIFSNIGNESGYQHYKDALKIIFFDMYARIENDKLKKIIKQIYKF